MKTLFAGIVLIILIGFAGFFYRNVAEQTGVAPVACTMEARICPDGSAVGRTGPSCEFAPCLFPNVELPEAQISLVAPEGYRAGASSETAVLGSFMKPSASGSVSHTITIRRYEIPEGESADEVILANTRYQPADMEAEDFSRFENLLINGKAYRATVIERFEALVQSSYFLAREADVLRFDIVEHDVTDWMEPTLDVAALPEHQALLQMLSTLQTP